MSDDPILRRFLPERHEDAVERFRAADIRIGELSKRAARSRLGGGIPGPNAFGADPEWGTPSRELTKRAAHMPLRKLFGHMPTALTRLTPCVMMSPLSIAQYLPPEKEPFDVVISDEASQISPWDAVGAIARGKQVVIVGDLSRLISGARAREACATSSLSWNLPSEVRALWPKPSHRPVAMWNLPSKER